MCRGHVWYPAFAPSISEMNGWFVAFLYLTVHNLLQLCMSEVGFSPLLVLCILLLEKTFV